MPRTRPFAGLAALVVALAATGCASTQIVRFQCVPREVKVYVDGQLLEGEQAALRTDRPHKVYAKGRGYQPRLVVLEPEVDADGRAAFRDEDLCIDVVPVAMTRELELEVERGAKPEGAQPHH
jgi:hypothetical protein